MTPEEHAHAHRLGDLYDRLSQALTLPGIQALLDILREYSYDDVVFMLNVLKEDLSR